MVPKEVRHSGWVLSEPDGPETLLEMLPVPALFCSSEETPSF